MKTSSAFHGDPVRYDRTRRFPPAVLAQVLAPLRAALPSGAAVLDLGAGTGRLALPLTAAGYAVVALDLSPRMLAYLQAKAPGLPLVQADAHALPFAQGAFRAVVTVHVLHLLADLPRALDEIARVLAPGGQLWLGYQHHGPDSVVGWTLRAWREALRRRGYALERPGWRDYAALVDELARLWPLTARYETLPWTVSMTPEQALVGVARRLFTPYQGLPEAEHQTMVTALTRAAQVAFGDLEHPRPDPRTFRWYVYTPPG